jgi:hypothetical protein
MGTVDHDVADAVARSCARRSRTLTCTRRPPTHARRVRRRRRRRADDNGWHKGARKYLGHKSQLSEVPFALFVTAASLTEDGVDTVRACRSPGSWLVEAANAERLSRKGPRPTGTTWATSSGCAPARPRAAVFAGSLDLTTMNLLEKAFVLVVIGATPGDGRHYEFIREWAAGLGGALRDA